jgi:hypothetical protein
MATQLVGHLGLTSEAVTGNKTLDEGDNGVAQVVTANAVVTLPATVVGYSYKIVVGETSTGGVPTLSVSPAAADKIMGLGFTSADNKDATLASPQVGDFIELVGDGVNGWVVAGASDGWSREA